MRPENEPNRGGRESREDPHLPTPARNMVAQPAKGSNVAKEIVALGSGAFNHCAQHHHEHPLR